MNLSNNDILKINDIVYDAGKAILDIYDTSFNVETKSDNSPLTQADKNAHSVIDSGLKSLFPIQRGKNGIVSGLLTHLMVLKSLLKEMVNSQLMSRLSKTIIPYLVLFMLLIEKNYFGL